MPILECTTKPTLLRPDSGWEGVDPLCCMLISCSSSLPLQSPSPSLASTTLSVSSGCSSSKAVFNGSPGGILTGSSVSGQPASPKHAMRLPLNAAAWDLPGEMHESMPHADA